MHRSVPARHPVNDPHVPTDPVSLECLSTPILNRVGGAGAQRGSSNTHQESPKNWPTFHPWIPQDNNGGWPHPGVVPPFPLPTQLVAHNGSFPPPPPEWFIAAMHHHFNHTNWQSTTVKPSELEAPILKEDASTASAMCASTSPYRNRPHRAAENSNRPPPDSMPWIPRAEPTPSSPPSEDADEFVRTDHLPTRVTTMRRSRPTAAPVEKGAALARTQLKKVAASQQERERMKTLVSRASKHFDPRETIGKKSDRVSHLDAKVNLRRNNVHEELRVKRDERVIQYKPSTPNNRRPQKSPNLSGGVTVRQLKGFAPVLGDVLSSGLPPHPAVQHQREIQQASLPTQEPSGIETLYRRLRASYVQFQQKPELFLSAAIATDQLSNTRLAAADSEILSKPPTSTNLWEELERLESQWKHLNNIKNNSSSELHK